MQLKFETGRSMVEIIGILAVAGVLSIGGVLVLVMMIFKPSLMPMMQRIQ